MEMRCAECGCLVDAEQVVERCADPECCCKDLPGAQTTEVERDHAPKIIR